ncbi:monosaccharide ABC transporter membrane protein, CUT2 family [Streptomyces sp. DvalAA-14]|uniref:ABC transporter permease n=1 Tax=unclassified Streptomyces TaxID=2593676 RepID=UPI00081B9FB4|nr:MULTISPECIES: ABC transporter permease [unclassified Streptomyces]MYS22398.1 ABC transporter permease [Streptomyces sp. SID4948]SCE15366.1 monosaccharide ABC transporter membrane protein, CUT2 family [Streptomyces sp. DvalAA-14]
MTALATPPPVTARVARGGSLLRARELGIGVAIVLVFVATTLNNHAFANAHSIQQLLTGASLIALLGVGETLVIVTRNVDLSVGSVVGVSAYVVGDVFKHHPGFPVPLGFLLGIAIGAVIGSVNGVITTVTRVPSLVVTLAMLYIVRGIDGVIVNGKTIDPAAIPKSFTEVGYKTVLGVPWLAVIVAVVVAIVGYAMRSFRASRDLYAIGSNPEAAALAGIPTGRRVFTAFLISGSLAGFAGALFLALHAQIDVTGGNGYELTVVSAVVVGGVAIFGGSGSVLGAALGAVLLNTINQALVATKISSFWNEAIAGGLLLAAIAFDRWLSLRVARSLQSAQGAHRDT